MFGLGIGELIIFLIISLIQIIVFFIIVGYAIYKKLRVATIEEIEMAKRINRGQGNVSQSAHQTNKDAEDTKLQPLIIITTIIYALQAAPIIFSFGITYFVAIIINYVKKDDVKGTWLESHFTWQRKTFWYSLLWAIGAIITGFFLEMVVLLMMRKSLSRDSSAITLIIIFSYFIFIADGIWVIYRIIKGWLNLSDKKKMYA